MSKNEINDQTRQFEMERDEISEAGYILRRVFAALEEKGYNPVDQIVGYLISGDPAYITSYKEARTMIRSIDRDEILEELLTNYIKKDRQE